MIKLLPFQETGRNFLALRPNAILADDMGLGKTYQIIEAWKQLGLSSGLVICPQSIRRSWVKRIREQMPLAFIKEIYSPKLVPESSAFNVVNYDIVWKEPLITLLKDQDWPVLVCDESHYLRTIEAKRTKMILGKKGLYACCQRRWMATGTPVLNRPVELYPILRALFPQFLGKYANFYDYAYKFCAAYQGDFGFDCTGASNLPDLADILRPIMLRRLKSEVQKELPMVTYDKVYLDPSDKLLALTQQENRAVNARDQIGEIPSIRRALGILKSAAAIRHIKDLLEEKQKVVVFVWHEDVVKAIAAAFPEEVAIYTGKCSAREKDAALSSFRSEKSKKIFLANIQSGGIGVDGLQHVCDTAVFVEMSYVPEEIRQAIGRLDRMGQKNPVQIQFLIAENSVDEKVVNTLTEKAKNINIITGDNERRKTNEIDETTEFVATKCKVCGRPTEMKKLKRVAGLSVCDNCRKNMECLL